MKIIRARYKEGAFWPSERIDLPDDLEVDIEVRPARAPEPRAKCLPAIAAILIEHQQAVQRGEARRKNPWY